MQRSQLLKSVRFIKPAVSHGTDNAFGNCPIKQAIVPDLVMAGIGQDEPSQFEQPLNGSIIHTITDKLR